MIKLKVLLSAALAFVLIANATAKLIPFDDLSDTDKSTLTETISGCLAPSVVDSLKTKGLVAIQSKIKALIRDTGTNLAALPALSTVSALISSFTDTLSAKVDTEVKDFKDLKGLKDKLTATVSSFPGISAFPAVTAAISNINIFPIIFETLDLNDYKGELKLQTDFYNVLDSAWVATFTQKQINAVSLLVEVPSTAAGKTDLIRRIAAVVSARPPLVTELESVFSTPTAKFTKAQLVALKPIMKDMTCFFLKRFDNYDFIVNWLFAKESTDTETIQKLFKCKMSLVASVSDVAVNISSNVASLDDNVKLVLSDYLVKYMNLIGITDPFYIINFIGPSIVFLPAGTLEKLISTDLTIIPQLFTTYSVQTNFLSFSPEWRTVIARYIMKYLNGLTTTLTTAQVNMLATIITEVPFDSIISLLDANTNYQTVLTYTNSLPDSAFQYAGELCDRYFDYLAVKAKTDTSITTTMLKKYAKYKTNCNFEKFIDGRTTADIVAFARDILALINPLKACKCRSTLGKYLKNCAASKCTTAEVSTALNSYAIPSCAVFDLKSDVDLSTLATQSIILDKNSAVLAVRGLTNIASYTMSQIKSSLKGLTIEYINSKADSEAYAVLSEAISQCSDIPKQKLVLYFTKALKHSQTLGSLKATVIVILNTSPDSLCYHAIDEALFKTANLLVSDITAVINKLPKKLAVIISAKQTAITSLTASNSDSFSITAAQLSALKGLTSVSDILNVVFKLKLDDVDEFKMTQIAVAIYNYFQKQSVNFPWSLLTDAIADKIEPTVYFGLDKDNLAQVLKLDAFKTILSKLSKVSQARCKSFSPEKTLIVINGAITLLGLEKATWSSDDLAKLGSFLSVRLPVKYITRLDATSFLSLINYFQSPCFQLSAADAATFSTYLGTVYAANPTTSISKWKELVIYLPDSVLNSITTSDANSNGDSVQENIKSNKDSEASGDVNDQQKFSGLTTQDISYQKDLCKKANEAIIQKRSSTAAVGRRRRQTSTLTCKSVTDVTSQGYYAYTKFSISELTGLAQSEFELCLTYFGNEVNKWPSDYITAFYEKIKSLYPTLSSMPSNVITDLGIIAAKFTSSELSQFTLTSYEAISQLGKLSTFSADQISSIVSAAKLNSITVTASTFLKVSGNLACGLSSSEVSSVSSTTLSDSLSSLSSIQSKNCNNLANWWSLYKSTKSPTSDAFTPESLTKCGSLAAGMTLSDFNSYMTTSDQANSLTSTALALLSSDVKSALLSSTIAEGLEPSQQSALGVYDKSAKASDAKTILMNPILLISTILIALFI